MEFFKLANLALRFLLELCALAALGYWGFQTGQTLTLKIVLAIAAPLVAAVVWGMFIAPRAAVPVPVWLWLLLQAAVFGCAAAGLVVTGHSTLAGVFLLIVLLNGILLYIWGQ
ncbi:MAG TPA: YrdB family protein [Roseiflexaceae bacterium]|nr:YrdB family protein [Roseiflexaceae bacterium]